MKTASFIAKRKSEQGLISADFLFSMVIAVGAVVLLFSMCFTLTVAEIAQYVVFSSSRAHASAHLDQDKQIEMAEKKFSSLVNNPVLKPLFFGENWFQLTNLEIKGGGARGELFEGYGDASRIPPIGTRARFTTKLLNIRLPFLGKTDVDGEGFSANLTAFLIREPTSKECLELHVEPRYSKILALDNRFTELTSGSASKYLPMEDNGC